MLPDIPLAQRAAWVKARPRYRARMLRMVILDMARYRQGVTPAEAAEEFWVQYGLEPKKSLVAQQFAMLHRDGHLEKVAWGAYRALVVAPSHAASSIFD